MKKLNISKIEEIKEKHFEYCSELDEVKNLTFDEKKALFVENPFTENMECDHKFNEEPFKSIDLKKRYTNFRKFKKKTWNGVDLIKMLNIDVCPYCGMSYISTIEKKRGQIVSEATLDHYLTKENKSMLALNIYNLVPSCKNCNSTFKCTSSRSVINPYFASVEENIKFELDCFDTNEELHINNVAQNDLSEITDNHIKELSLKNRYNYFKNIALSIYKKKLAWNKTYVSQLTDFKELGITEEEVEKMLIYQDIFNGNEPFIKLKTDVWAQINIEEI